MVEIILIIIGYTAGSIPTAYLFLKFFYNIDIRKEGTGNVGAMNSYDVTKSRKTGIAVFAVDFLKGALPVALSLRLTENDFTTASFVLCASVLAHCYSPWLKFKGGRGLATAAGGAVILSPLILAGWLFGWIISYFPLKNVHLANLGATLIIWIFSIIFVNYFLRVTFANPAKPEIFIFSVSILFFIILSKHFSPILSLIKRK